MRDLNASHVLFSPTTGGGKKGSRARLSTVATGLVCSFAQLSRCRDSLTSIGQTKPVHVYQLIAEDTVESKVRDRNPGRATLVH